MRKMSAKAPLLLAAVAALSANPLFAADKVNYQDDVLPILRNACLNCHNADKKKAGLDLSTFQTSLAGSNNGPVINPGDPDGSLLYKVVTHAEDPTMPPKKDKLPDKELNVFKAWIAGGALETASGKPVASTKPKIDLSVSASGTRRPDGPPPMPQNLLPEPTVRGARAWAPACITASPWAPVVAIGGPHQIFLYNTSTLELLGVIPFDDGQPDVVQFSRNGKLLLVGGGIAAKTGKVSLWDLSSGTKITDVGDEFDAVLAADLSPDQTHIALGGPSKSFKIYATRDGALVHVMRKHTDWVTAVAYSPDGVLVASADRAGGMWVWEAKSGGEFYNLAGHKAAITSIAFRDDSNFLASASEDGTVKLWDMQSGKEVKSWQAHGGGVLSVAFTHDGRLVTCGRDRAVKLWTPEGSQIREFGTFNDIALHVAFDCDGKRVVAGDWTGDLRVWDAGDGVLLGHLSTNPPPLAERIIAAEAQAVERQKAADKASADLAAANAQVERSIADQKSAVAAADAARVQIADNQAKLNAAAETLNAAKSALSAAQAKVNEVDAAGKDLQKRADECQGQLKEASAATAPLKDALAARQKEADAASSTLAAARADAAKKPDDSQLAEAVKSAQGRADQSQAALASAQQALKARTDQVEAMTKELAQASDDARRAQENLSNARKAVADATAALEKRGKTRGEAEAALAKARAASADADKAVPPHESAIKSAKEQLAKIKAAADDAGNQLSVARAQVNRLKVGQFYLGVYAARQEWTARQAEADHLAAAAHQGEVDADSASAALAMAIKSQSDAPRHLKDLQGAIDKSRQDLAMANGAVQQANDAVAQKQALVQQATEFQQKLAAEAQKSSADKPLADAVAHARGAADALNAEVELLKQQAAAKGETVKSAAAAVASAESELGIFKADVDALPKKIEALRSAMATAQAQVARQKSAVDAASKTAGEFKEKYDRLFAEYQKKSQDPALTTASAGH